MLLKPLQRLAIIGVFVLHTFTSLAQTIELDKVGRTGFEGIQKLDSLGYYFHYETVNTTPRLLTIITLDNNLAVLNEIKRELKTDDKVEDIACNNGNFLFIKSNKKEKLRIYETLDKQGKTTATKTEAVTHARLLEKPAIIAAVDQTDFIVINHIKDKKEGYRIERFNTKLESKYIQMAESDKKKLAAVEYAISNTLFYVLEYISSDLSNHFEYHIAGYSLADGKLLFNNYLKSSDDKSFGQTSFIRLTPDGSVITGGNYQDSPREGILLSEGLFTALIDANGNMSYQYQSWKTLEDKIKTSTSKPIWEGKTQAFIHDIIIHADSTFTLVSESFRIEDEGLQGGRNKTVGILSRTNTMSSSDTPLSYESVTVSAFVLFHFSKDNTLKGFRELDKPNSLLIVRPTNDPDNQPSAQQGQGFNLVNILHNKGYFPYKFTVDKNGEKILVYQFTYEKLFKERLFFVRLNSLFVNDNSIDITNSFLKAQKELDFRKNEKKASLNSVLDTGIDPDMQSTYYIKGTDNPQDYRSLFSNTRISSSNLSQKILIYDFIPELSGSNDEKRSMLNENDDKLYTKLKIWYIAVP